MNQQVGQKSLNLGRRIPEDFHGHLCRLFDLVLPRITSRLNDGRLFEFLQQLFGGAFPPNNLRAAGCLALSRLGLRYRSVSTSTIAFWYSCLPELENSRRRPVVERSLFQHTRPSCSSRQCLEAAYRSCVDGLVLNTLLATSMSTCDHNSFSRAHLQNRGCSLVLEWAFSSW